MVGSEVREEGLLVSIHHLVRRTDEDRLLDEGLETDSLDDKDEIIILKDIRGE